MGDKLKLLAVYVALFVAAFGVGNLARCLAAAW